MIHSTFVSLHSVSSNWKSFVHQLGGLLCASLNFVDSNVSSTSPHYSFRPQSTLPMANQSYQDSSLLRYAVLPREIVCTGSILIDVFYRRSFSLLLIENLTPWKKFLPCSAATTSNHQGLIALLDNAPKLHHSSYHSLRMDLRKICSVMLLFFFFSIDQSSLFEESGMHIGAIGIFNVVSDRCGWNHLQIR